MFYRKQLGETEDDIFYTEQVMKDDLLYAQAMLNQPITDYEKEQWQAEISQFSGILADIGIPNSNYSQTFSIEPGVLTAGFDLGSNWPMMAIIGVGFLMMFKKGPKHTVRRKRRQKR